MPHITDLPSATTSEPARRAGYSNGWARPVFPWRRRACRDSLCGAASGRPASFRFQQGDGVFQARVARGGGIPEVIQAAKRVVMPVGRENEAGELRPGHGAGAMRAEEAVEEQELPPARLAAAAGARPLRRRGTVRIRAALRAPNGGIERTVGDAAIARGGAGSSSRRRPSAASLRVRPGGPRAGRQSRTSRARPGSSRRRRFR